MNKNDIWQYIDYDNKKILDKNAIMRIWKRGTVWSPTADPNDLIILAQMSNEGRKLAREYSEWVYNQILKERPDSFFTKIAKNRVKKDIEMGIDPFDDAYRATEKSEDGITFMKLLISFMRSFV